MRADQAERAEQGNHCDFPNAMESFYYVNSKNTAAKYPKGITKTLGTIESCCARGCLLFALQYDKSHIDRRVTGCFAVPFRSP